ncbi:MAG: hypothetical protein JWO36_3220 [Myxococcales bacterium]|nr:hypothetical protein [Myxococcales bacterium]
MRLSLVAVAIALVCSRPVHADTRDIVIETPGERTPKNKLVIGGIAGAGVLIGALGAYFNLDSRNAAADVSTHDFTHLPWTPERQSRYDQANSSGTDAKIAYGLGGAMLLGAVIAYLATDPKPETTVIHPHQAGPSPTIQPVPGGGAMVGGSWSF